MWRTIRISVLLVILGFVALSAWLDRHLTTSWQHTVWVGAFPVNADGSAASTRYLATLDEQQLAPIAAFISSEAHRYGVGLDEPIRIRLYPPLSTPPPTIEPDASVLGRIIFSLKLRHYRWQVLRQLHDVHPQIALFLLYHDPSRSARLPHSLGLQRGLMSVVHLFADSRQDDQNAIVTAHELLHTFGATDKYAPDSDAPLFPDGFADPALEPRYPQRRAELMAGRIPVSPTQQVMPDSLQDVTIGPASAREIGWIRSP